MTLPAHWPIVHITGSYIELDGTPCKGQIVFSAPRELSIDGVVVLPRKLMLDLDADGNIAGDVPASDYPDADAPFAYVVSEQLIGHAPNSYALIVPTGDTLDLATAVPAVIDNTAPAYRLQIGTVTDGDTAAASLTPVSRNAQALNLTLPTTGPSSGITQSQGDARYVRLTQINAASGVPGLDANSFMTDSQLPLPPVTLTVLLANKLA